MNSIDAELLYEHYGLTCPPRWGTMRDFSRQTYGPKVAKIAKALGTPLMPWQRYAVDVGLEVDPETGLLAYRGVDITVPRQSGKALDVETPLLTDRGWITMAEVKVGDEVYAPDGSRAEVTATSPAMADHDCYRVTTTDGRSVVADADHLWTVQDRLRERSRGPRGGPRTRWFEWRTMTTRQLVDEGLMRMAQRTVRTGGKDYQSREFRFRLPRQHALRSPDVALSIEPYLFGVWLGDGKSTAGEISVGFDDIDATTGLLLAAGHEIVSSYRRRTCWTVRIRGLQAALRRLGMLGAKRVPDEYLTAGTEQRLALLQGLLDTDGSISSGNSGTPRVEFCATNRHLADAVLYLARSLGWRATLKTGAAKIDGRTVGTKWRVCFTPTLDERTPFRMPRKVARIGASRARGGELHAVSIASIEPVESRPVRCIKVDSPGELYLAGRDLIATHNTSLILPATVWRAMRRPKQRIVYGAQTGVAAREKWEDEHLPMLEAARPLKGKFRTRKAAGREAILYANGSIHSLLANTEKAGHGKTLDMAALDEYFAQVDYRSDQAVGPAMITRPDAQKWRLSTAGTSASVPFNAMRKRGREVLDKGLPSTTAFMDWCALPSQPRTEFETWLTCMPALCPAPVRGMCRCSREWRHTTTQQAIHSELETYASQPEDFDRAYLNIGRDDGDLSRDPNVPTVEEWALLADVDVAGGDIVALAVDITPSRDHAAIVAVGDTDAGLPRIRVLDHGEGVEWVIPRLLELLARLKPVCLVLDDKSPAGTLILPLERKGVVRMPQDTDDRDARKGPQRGQLWIPTPMQYGAACGTFTDTVRQGGLVHSGQESMTVAIDGAKSRPLGDGLWGWGRKIASADISPLVAATLAMTGLDRWRHLAVKRIEIAAVNTTTSNGAGMFRPTGRLKL